MDELLLSKVRLTVVAELLAAEWLTFSDLQKSAGTTNGNLGGHLGKLVVAGYVQEEKRFVGRRPQTRYRLRRTGRLALLRHVAALQELVDAGIEAS
jgi:predicted ArsR family transcriptional regulator